MHVCVCVTYVHDVELMHYLVLVCDLVCVCLTYAQGMECLDEHMCKLYVWV